MVAHMAQRVQVLLIDDLDGSEGAETVSFSLDGVSYEIDLSEKNAAKLRDNFATWVGNARKVGRGGSSASGRSGARRSRGSANDTGAIRAWARDNGFEVSERGRISREVMDAYNAAH
jgi:hypothetical protein